MRTRRMLARIVDGGVSLLVLAQCWALVEYSSSLYDVYDDLYDAMPEHLAPVGHHFVLFAGVCVLFELVWGAYERRRGRAPGFTLAGLDLERATARRPLALRRAFVTLPCGLACVAGALLMLLAPSWMPPTACVRAARWVLLSALLLCLGVFAFDALKVLGAPLARTLGDRLAAVEVVSARMDEGRLRASCVVSMAASLTFALVEAAELAMWALAEGAAQMSLELSPLLSVSALSTYVWIASVAANASTLLVLSTQLTRASGAPEREPALVALLSTLPLVSFFFVGGLVRRISIASGFAHDDGIALRGLFDLAYATSALVGVAALANAYTALVSSPELVEPTALALGRVFGALVTGVAFRRLAALSLREIAEARGEADAQVFT